MNEFTPHQYDPYDESAAHTERSEAVKIYDEPIVETGKKYEMSAADIDNIASVIFEQVAQNPDGVAYHIYNSDQSGEVVRNQQLDGGHNYIRSDDPDVNNMQELVQASLDQVSSLKKDDRFTRPEVLVIEDQGEGDVIVGYGLQGVDDFGRPKQDHVSFKLSGEAAAMIYVAVEDPVAIDEVIKMVGYTSGLPEAIYQNSFNPSHGSFSDQVLNIVKTGPSGSEFSRIKKRSKSTIK